MDLPEIPFSSSADLPEMVRLRQEVEACLNDTALDKQTQRLVKGCLANMKRVEALVRKYRAKRGLD